MKRLILLIVFMLVDIASANNISGGSISNGFRLGGPELIEEPFVSLEASSLYGTSGTLANLANRIYQPRELIPPDFTTWTQNTNLINHVCSGDNTSWATNVVSEINTAANKTVIWLPADCMVNLYMAANTGAGSAFTWPIDKDEVALMCVGGGDCGLMGRFNPGAGTDGSPNWDHTDSASITGVGGRTFQQYMIAIGSAKAAAIHTCGWNAGYAINSKMVQLSGTGSFGCTINNNLDAADIWGPGDIVRLKVNSNIAEAKQYFFTTRITCIKTAAGVQIPAGVGNPLCNQITGNNQLQLEDGLMMDYSPTAYHWGQNAGSSYWKYPDAAAGGGTYQLTSGHTIEHVERVGSGRCNIVGAGVCGVGAETNNVIEDVWFVNLKWNIYPSYIGGNETRWINAFGGGSIGNIFDSNPGYVSHTTFGNANTEASGILYLSNDFNGSAGNSKCFGRIRAIRQTNPIEIDIDTEADWIENDVAVDCSFISGDIQIGFTEDVVDPRLSGKILAKTAVSETLGSPDITTIQLIGINGRCDTGICVDTTVGGLAVHIDSFAGAVMYCNNNANRVQVVNNVIRNPGQGPIVQAGCSSFTYAANFMRTDNDHRRGRGPFFHGNGGAPSALFEMNDSDQKFVYQDTSNRPNQQDMGEGHNHTIFKNRFIQMTNTWPLGTTLNNHWTGNESSGMMLWANQEDQWGQSNENWNIFENVAKDIFDGTALIDFHDNMPDSPEGAPSVTLAPYVLKNLAFFRNRSYGAGVDMDNNFDTVANNPTTLTDVLGKTGGANTPGTNYEDDDVPASYLAEIDGVPTSILFRNGRPSWWCKNAMPLGAMGAHYDDFNGGTLGKLPAELRFLGIPCEL